MSSVDVVGDVDELLDALDSLPGSWEAAEVANCRPKLIERVDCYWTLVKRLAAVVGDVGRCSGS